jgi:SagB-type dehydrogenase family enzyme
MINASVYYRAGLMTLLTVSYLVLPMRSAHPQAGQTIRLPTPESHGVMSVEEALHTRRSVRTLGDEALSLTQLGQLLWAAQGLTDAEGHRTTPSAGARYPLEIYVVAGNVADVPQGVYKYRPQQHALVPHLNGDYRSRLVEAAVQQDWIAGAPVVFVIASVDERTRARYRDRTSRYVAIEVGHVGQSVYLQATALSLGTTMVGAFQDDSVTAVLQLDRTERPLALMPMGKPVR